MTDMTQMQLAAALARMPVVANADHTPLEDGEDPAFGTVRWRTLFCADKTETAGMVMGVAEFGPEGTLKPHRHGPAKIYFGLEGTGSVTIDGVTQEVSPGIALFIPEEAEQGIVAGAEGFRMLYVFPNDRFSDVDYRFTGEAGASDVIAQDLRVDLGR